MALKVGDYIHIGSARYLVQALDRGQVGVEDDDGNIHVFPDEILRVALMGDKMFVEAKSLLDKSRMFRIVAEETVMNSWLAYYDAISVSLACGLPLEESQARHKEILAQLDAWTTTKTEWEDVRKFFEQRKRRWMDS